MNWSAKYYRENLYPFQDGVLNIVKKSSTPFYLTGGTALSRGYFNHRYSDDLDLFVNQDDRYSEYVQTLLAQFDIVDLWVIAKHQRFDWKTIVEEAKTKEAGIDPVVLFEILKSFPPDALSTIKWVTPVDSETFTKDLHQIADDIFQGKQNSLVVQSKKA